MRLTLEVPATEPTGRRATLLPDGEWEMGECWLWCYRRGLPVAWIGTGSIGSGQHAGITACENCQAAMRRRISDQVDGRKRRPDGPGSVPILAQSTGGRGVPASPPPQPQPAVRAAPAPRLAVHRRTAARPRRPWPSWLHRLRPAAARGGAR